MPLWTIVTIFVVVLFGPKLLMFALFKATERTIQEIGKSPTEMRAMTGMPFSAKTGDMHYFVFAGGMQDLQMYCKFRSSTADVDAVVEEFIAQNEAHSQERNHLCG